MVEQMHQKPKMAVIMDSDAEKVWCSQEYNNGDFPFRILLNLQYCEHWSEEWANTGKFYVMVQIVSLQQAKDKISNIMESCGFTQEDWDKMDESFKHYEMASYGVAAVLWQQQGNNQKVLIKAAKMKLTKF